ncbi:MAG: hypothetical protein ACOYLG_10870 [Chitinophagaceae bacterium]|jgi:hypothetical protein
MAAFHWKCNEEEYALKKLKGVCHHLSLFVYMLLCIQTTRPILLDFMSKRATIFPEKPTIYSLKAAKYSIEQAAKS